MLWPNAERSCAGGSEPRESVSLDVLAPPVESVNILPFQEGWGGLYLQTSHVEFDQLGRTPPMPIITLPTLRIFQQIVRLTYACPAIRRIRIIRTEFGIVAAC